MSTDEGGDLCFDVETLDETTKEYKMIAAYKYRLEYEKGKECIVSMPNKHNWLHVGFQGDNCELYLWVAVDTEAPMEEYRHIVVMTGQDVGLTKHEFLYSYAHVGSAMTTIGDAPFVLHVWAEREAVRGKS